MKLQRYDSKELMCAVVEASEAEARIAELEEQVEYLKESYQEDNQEIIDLTNMVAGLKASKDISVIKAKDGLIKVLKTENQKLREENKEFMEIIREVYTEMCFEEYPDVKRMNRIINILDDKWKEALKK